MEAEASMGLRAGNAGGLDHGGNLEVERRTG